MDGGWEIEHLFQCLKSRCFHLEETRLTRYFRIKKVMALLAPAFCRAHKTGEWKHQAVKPLKTKKHGGPEQSLFHYGLDYLTNSLLQGCQAIEERLRLWVLFLCISLYTSPKNSYKSIKINNIYFIDILRLMYKCMVFMPAGNGRGQ
jgi:hypothetical protein